ncbi:MAG: hypothetical protein HYW89_03000 [Candidatus Sungiibacteriota bacterium]|uniref:Uncharacterized protein n=1 Tax=Candidatus Sungiibacteriota bacterium TaxID=2750080 RepID=A0A7T5RIU1_9BACT|nr:MAG: hypothetical protein HYW89_03000 [Candidatus Sungbacteria bacterium]
MTLTTHTIIAAAVTKPLASIHPAFSFLAALASHYLSDAIPHWDYKLKSAADDEDNEKRHWEFSRRTILGDLGRVTLDGFLGAALVFLLLSPATPNEWIRAILIIIGGALPDFLEGLFYTRKLNFLSPVHHFHSFTHTKIKLGPYPLIGVPFQLLILFLAFYLLF